jgi:hypothetical protein
MAFNFKETRVAQIADEIRDDNQHTSIAPVAAAPTEPAKDQVAPVAEPTTPAVQAPAPNVIPSPVKAKKTTNGIVIDVPMQEYKELIMMKVQTGRTLKDLALQAIREFVERNDRVGQ